MAARKKKVTRVRSRSRSRSRVVKSRSRSRSRATHPSRTARRSRTGGDSYTALMGRAQRNFILFLILFIVSYLFYSFSSNILFRNFFGITSVIFGFVSFAFIIAIIVVYLTKRS